MKLDFKKYKANWFKRCPYCDSDYISPTNEHDETNDFLKFTIKCGNCHKYWSEVFKMVDIKEIKQ